MKKKEIIGWVSDPLGKNVQPVLATVSGIVIGRASLPLVNEGEALFHIAIFNEPDSAAEMDEVFQEEHDPQYDDDINEEPPPCFREILINS